MQVDCDRTHCDCGEDLGGPGGGNWGEWNCRKCFASYCQDCGSQINHWTGECIAYEELKESWERGDVDE